MKAWDNINATQYHCVLTHKGETDTVPLVKEFLARNECNVKYEWMYPNDKYCPYPLMREYWLKMYIKFFDQWHKPRLETI